MAEKDIADTSIKGTSTKDTSIKDMSFEQALAELEAIVETMEAGKVDLNSSIATYERGEKLKKHCDAMLKEAEARVEKITLSGDGTATGTEPLDVE